jgi:hypothetical protein
MMKTVIPLMALTMLLAQCKSVENEVPEPSEEVALTPDTTLYTISVNNLRMRDEPNLQGNTIMMLPENGMVQYWGEHSSEKLQIKLRGQDVSDFWYRVKYGKSIGWVFGGALTVNKSKEAHDYLIVPGERVGPVKADDSEASIIERIGGDQVQRGDFIIGQGESVKATYLYPATENELILLWDQEDFQTLREIRIRKTGSKWKLTNGLTIGTKLTEVTRANAGPFLLSGFEWDYGGMTLNWQGGSLSSDLVLIFEAPGKVHKALIGDQSISSEENHMVKANPVVKTMRILF